MGAGASTREASQELCGKPLQEWTADEVRGTLKIVAGFVKDGAIPEASLNDLCGSLLVDPPAATTGLVVDGKLDARAFFVHYTGCAAPGGRCEAAADRSSRDRGPTSAAAAWDRERPRTGRGDAAAGTWTDRGRVAATP